MLFMSPRERCRTFPQSTFIVGGEGGGARDEPYVVGAPERDMPRTGSTSRHVTPVCVRESGSSENDDVEQEGPERLGVGLPRATIRESEIGAARVHRPEADDVLAGLTVGVGVDHELMRLLGDDVLV